MSRHSWSAMQQHHHLQSASLTGRQPALSTDISRLCEISFVALHRHTGWSRLVAVSSDRHCSDPEQCGSDTGKAIGLWGWPLNGSWPLRPNSSLSSADLWCLLDKSLATVDTWMTVAVVVSKECHGELANYCEQLLFPPAFLLFHSLLWNSCWVTEMACRTPDAIIASSCLLTDPADLE